MNDLSTREFISLVLGGLLPSGIGESLTVSPASTSTGTRTHVTLTRKFQSGKEEEGTISVEMQLPHGGLESLNCVTSMLETMSDITASIFTRLDMAREIMTEASEATSDSQSNTVSDSASGSTPSTTTYVMGTGVTSLQIKDSTNPSQVEIVQSPRSTTRSVL